MQINQIIQGNPIEKRIINKNQPFLNISEFFGPTIQGENFVGFPAYFLRLQSCTLNCTYCDTQEVWRFGNPYTINELLDLMEKHEVIKDLSDGVSLVLTGGSPLLQEENLLILIESLINRFDIKPFIEIENECTILPSEKMIEYVDIWNNSPKLQGSGNPKLLRYRPDVLKKLSKLDNSWFKFVISKEEEWDLIVRDYLEPELIKKPQIVLMPLGATRKELHENREKVIEIAINNRVRYTGREHVEIWDIKTGV